MECKYKVGDEVVCVDDIMLDTNGTELNSGLVLGKIYTITEIVIKDGFYIKYFFAQPVVKVKETQHPWNESYHHLRFQPLKKTDISVFQDMLKKIRIPVDA